MRDLATPEQREMIRQMKATIDMDGSPVEDLLRLGQLYIYPMMSEGEALPIFEKILERDPDNAWATFWLAYCYKWYWMVAEWLLKARKMLESWIASHGCAGPNVEACAAMYELLVEIGDDTPLEDITDIERVRLLEESVTLAPGWVKNREMLARAYVSVGRISDAIVQLKAAQANAIELDMAEDPVKKHFEQEVTGRGNDYVTEEVVPNMLKRLQAG